MTKIEIEASSGNVFADLGRPDAEALKRKSTLMIAISEVIDRSGLDKEEAAQRAGISADRLALLLRGDFSLSEAELQSLLDRLHPQGGRDRLRKRKI